MITYVFFFLILIQIKHWYVDFVNQSMEEVNSKGKYGDGPGVNHSAKHGIGTMVCAIIVCGLPYIALAAILGFIDFVLHYHIDWAKMNYSNRDVTTPAFWNHLGLDQMAHQITYLGLAYLIT